MEPLSALIDSLRSHPNVAEKLNILQAYAPSLPVSGGIEVGDDAAAIPDGNGYLLFAAEGMMEAFIEKDPWFAGYSAVMVNLSDIAAMGGMPTAVVDVMWTHSGSPIAAQIWEGMRAASAAYGVPIVGGHTTRFPIERTPLLAAAVVGRAQHLISSFDARPRDALMMAVDLRGAYRWEGSLCWNASVNSPPERLQTDLRLLAELANEGQVTAGKDISNGGVPGTLAMLLATSQCGAILNLDAVPMPPGVDMLHWLVSFPSYGYLLSVRPEKVAEVRAKFQSRDIACEVIGDITPSDEGASAHPIMMHWKGESMLFTEVNAAPRPV
ncbi:sll0787 family AIR synthase-like protein [Roseimicrobium sp. ORNL1]|uniref:sll0787 family AIR synthase-like protein n=1 Tax=Roseimicrobium sp. ORNL1 TaxID=2711231 RepID=UPI0013E15B93|nr:sll0787 family AIR synthase-like protein [Roseimicrobium sp. ORNL1]QIF01125.1 sll0787 family AIR synthase-like protein [Roseimicrobium sp. ORNL1]